MLLILLGVALQIHLDHARLQCEQDALIRSNALAQDYARQLSSTVREIDQITLTLAYYWKITHGALRLEDQLQHGVFPSAKHLHVTLVDRTGFPRTSTIAIAQHPTSIATRDYFIAHRDHPDAGLLISSPRPGLRLSSMVALFSRRLETADGGFDGLVIVAVEPAGLLAFHHQAHLIDDDLIAAVRDDGAVVAAQGVARDQMAADGGSGLAWDTRYDGARQLPIGQFKAYKAGVLAVKKVDQYPLRAVVGLGQVGYRAAYRQDIDTSRHIALGTALMVVLLGAGGMAVAMRLAWRKFETAQIQQSYALAIEAGLEGYYSVAAELDEDDQVVDFVIQDCNERGAGFLRTQRAALLGKRFSDLYSGEHGQKVLQIFRQAMQLGFYEDEFLVPPESPLKQCWMHRRLVRSGNGLAMTLRDISQTKTQQLSLQRMANHDALTELPNRYWLMHFLPAAVERARQLHSMLAVLYIDLDDFKPVNDRFGHAAGDQLLQLVALRLQSVIRPDDHAVRLGGDEFTLVVQNFHEVHELTAIAQRLLTSLAAPFHLQAGAATVRASIGISIFPLHCDDHGALLRYADAAMYAAKQEGKGGFRMHQSTA